MENEKRIRSTYFNPIAIQKMQYPDYWSANAQLRRMYDLKFRAVAQFRYAVEVQKHAVYFATLTFSNDNLFWFRHPLLNKQKIQGFDHAKINKFWKNIRDYLLRYYNVTSIVYLCASELGHNTHRPHYHILFSMPESIGDKEVYNIISKFWNYGFIFPRKYDGGADDNGYNHKPLRVNTDSMSNAVAYCSKYALKDVCNPNNIYADAERRLSHDNDALKALRRSEPRLKTSLGFGSAIEYYLFDTYPDIEEAYHAIAWGCAFEWYSDDLVALPQYSKLRLFYNNKLWKKEIHHVSDTETKTIYRYIRQRTDLWKDYRKSMLNDIIRKEGDDLSNDACGVVLDRDFAQFLSTDCLSSYLERINKVNWDDVALYAYVYRNRVSPSHLLDSLNLPNLYRVTEIETRDNVSHWVTGTMPAFPTFREGPDMLAPDTFVPMPKGFESLEEMRAFAPEFLSLLDDVVDYADTLYLNTFEFPDEVYFNAYPCFKGFDMILDVIYSYRKWRNEQKKDVLQQICNDELLLMKKNFEEFSFDHEIGVIIAPEF